MVDVNKAFPADNGFYVDESLGGPFYTGGVASPVGQGLPDNTVYTQTISEPAGFLIWKKIGSTDTASDWRLLGAKDLSFDPSGQKFDAVTIQQAIQEAREKTTVPIIELTSTLNGNHNIALNDSNIHVVLGSATGYTVTLPDATALFTGRKFSVVNRSSESIEVKDNSGNSLAVLISDDTSDFTCETNLTAAGTWLATIVTSAATGITSYVVASNTTFSTTSAADILVTGFLITPAPGRYALFISGDATIVGNNRLAQYVAYVAGSAVENTRRQVQGVGSNYNISLATIGEVSVNGLQQVDVRVNITANALEVNARSLILIRLGGQ